MTCFEFEESWQELLDDPSGSWALVDGLEEHAAICTACAEKAAGYQVLLAGLGRPRAEVSPPPGFAQRVLIASGPMPPWRTFRIAHRAVAASLLVGTAGLIAWVASERSHRPPVAPPALAEAPAVASPRPLSESFADYASGSLTLAVETSRPAAKVGMAALSAPDSTVGETEEEVIEVRPSPTGPWRRLAEDMRPLEGSVRHAFSFLIRPSPGGKPAPGNGEPL